MSCSTYINSDFIVGTKVISGTTCEGIVGEYQLEYNESICMDNNEPLILCNGVEMLGSCQPVGPTPTPTETPTNTPTNTVTPTVTTTNTQTPTPTNTPTLSPGSSQTPTPTTTTTPTLTPSSTSNAVCPTELQFFYEGNTTQYSAFTGTYERAYSYTGGTFVGGYVNVTAPGDVYTFIAGPDSMGNLGSIFTRFDGSIYYTLIAFAVNGGDMFAYVIYQTSTDYIFNGQDPLDYAVGLDTIGNATNIGGVLFPHPGDNDIAPTEQKIITYPAVCPTATPTQTPTQTPTKTPTQTQTPTVTLTPSSTNCNYGVLYFSSSTTYSASTGYYYLQNTGTTGMWISTSGGTNQTLCTSKDGYNWSAWKNLAGDRAIMRNHTSPSPLDFRLYVGSSVTGYTICNQTHTIIQSTGARPSTGSTINGLLYPLSGTNGTFSISYCV